MINIIKSLNYSARRDTVIWIVIITILIMPLFMLYLSGMLNPDTIQKMTPSAYFASQEMGTAFIFMSVGIMIFASKLVAGDAGDKTINYEFMAGHSRNRIFVGRVVAGFLWGAVLVWILMMIPLGYLTLIYGWGPETKCTEVLFRCFLVIFPIIRLCSLNIMLASVSRSAGKGIALGFAVMMVVSMVVSVIQDLLEKDITYPTGMTNAAFLLVPKNSKYVVINGTTTAIYDTTVTGEMIWKTIAVSLIFSAVYLIVAYVNFKKKDRD